MKKPSKKEKGKCVVCDKMTTEMNRFCDGVDEEGQPDSVYKDFCHENCYEYLNEKL